MRLNVRDVDMDGQQNADIQLYARPIVRALIVQAIFGILAGMNLDMGQTMSAYLYLSLPFWIGVGIIAVRRKSHPTKGDLLYIAYGLIPIMIGGIPLFFYVWERKGAL